MSRYDGHIGEGCVVEYSGALGTNGQADVHVACHGDGGGGTELGPGDTVRRTIGLDAVASARHTQPIRYRET